MSECVVRMKMPESCDVCPCLDDDGDYPRCRISNEQRGFNFPIHEKRMPKCPITQQLPEGHGRLIDWDAFERIGFKLCRKTNEGKAELGTPTNESYVVPAERSENMKYRKKPVVIEAYQTDKELDIETLEDTMHASVGDYIITGVRGEKYPCKPDIFEQTYEPADAPTASPWHMVEEKPKEADQYFVIWENNGDRGGGAAWFSLRLGWIWDGPKITHWMPIEPPKEDA